MAKASLPVSPNIVCQTLGQHMLMLANVTLQGENTDEGPLLSHRPRVGRHSEPMVVCGQSVASVGGERQTELTLI